MAKRFTEINKWADPWYRKLTPKLKTLWQYLCDKCDNAGVWKVDYELASFYIGESITKEDLNILNNGKNRAILINDDYLVISDFIPFQIGNISRRDLTNLQKNCISLLDKYLTKGINIQEISNLTGKLPVAIRYKHKGIVKGKGKGISIGKKTQEVDFIQELKKNQAYEHIDIDIELKRMDAWFLLPKAKGRKKTKQFILNWLNKIEKPMHIAGPYEGV